MYEIDAVPLNFNHHTVYTHVVIACNGPNCLSVQTLKIQQ